jgi:limonene-1,2-epoxide hydrolase
MLRELRIWLRLRPITNRFQELTKMKFSVNVAVQMLALAAQGLNATMELLPGRCKFWAMVGLSAVQGVTAVLAHFANPDGTPAQVAYLKK